MARSIRLASGTDAETRLARPRIASSRAAPDYSWNLSRVSSMYHQGPEREPRNLPYRNVHLIQPARLIPARHEEKIGPGLDPVGQDVVAKCGRQWLQDAARARSRRSCSYFLSPDPSATSVTFCSPNPSPISAIGPPPSPTRLSLCPAEADSGRPANRATHAAPCLQIRFPTGPRGVRAGRFGSVSGFN